MRYIMLRILQESRAINYRGTLQRIKLIFYILIVFLFSTNTKASEPLSVFSICSAKGNQGGPCIISDDKSGAIIIWTDGRRRFGKTNYRDWDYRDIDLYAQRIDKSGNVLWRVDGVLVAEDVSEKAHARMVADGEGGAIITWGAYVKRIDGGGKTRWHKAIGQGLSIGRDAKLVNDRIGGYIIVWRQGVDVLAQKFDSDGNAKWGDRFSYIAKNVRQAFNFILSDRRGSSLFFWINQNNETPGKPLCLFAKKLDTNGKPLWGPKVIYTYNNDSQVAAYPFKVISDESEGAIIFLRDNFTMRIDASGETSWIKSEFLDFGGYGNLILASNDLGGAYCVYYGIAPPFPICIQAIDSRGTVAWRKTLWQEGSASIIKEDGYGGVYVIGNIFCHRRWYSYLQQVKSDGTILWPSDGIMLSDKIRDTGSTASSVVAGMGIVDGAAIVLFSRETESRHYEHDIYATIIKTK